MNNEREGDFNPVLAKEYRDYKYEIYLDAERECLSGEVLGLNGWYDSDSLTHLIEQIERRIDLEICYEYQNRLAKEIKELEKEVEQWKQDVYYYSRLIGEI